MRSLLYGRDDELVAWAEARIPNNRFRGDAKAIGVERDGVTVGVFVYDTFSSTNCFMHVASDGSATWLPRDPREVLTPIFAFPFTQCGYGRVSAVISEHNTRSLRFVRRMGAKQEGVLRRAAPTGEDLILFGLLREECPWLVSAPRLGYNYRAPAHDVQVPNSRESPS